MNIDFSIKELENLTSVLEKTLENVSSDISTEDLEDLLNKIGLVINDEEDFQEFLKTAPYSLSENQTIFVRDCFRLDLEIDWEYSGRMMFGRKCPATVISSGGLSTTAKYCTDNMGLSTVFYAKD